MSDLPRVSGILSLLYPNSLDYVRDEHLERGTWLHTHMEILVNNQIYNYEDQAYTVPAECTRVMEWLKAEKVEYHGTEELCTHTYGFQGHPDLLAKWKNVDYWIDYKFSEQISEQNQMQGTAYCYLTGRKGLFLQCNREGQVKAVKCKPNAALWSAFLSGLNVWKFLHRKAVA